MIFEWVLVSLLSIYLIVRIVWLASQSDPRHETKAMRISSQLVSTALWLSVTVRVLIVFDVTGFDYAMGLLSLSGVAVGGSLSVGTEDSRGLREIDRGKQIAICAASLVFWVPVLVCTIVLR